MNFDNFIKSFFGFPSRNSPHHHPNDPDSHHLDGDSAEAEPPFDDIFGGHNPMRDFFRMQEGFHDIFRQFEQEIMKGFGSSDIFSPGTDLPSLEPPPFEEHQSPREEMLKPRDKMLKRGDEQERLRVPHDEQDTDGAPSWFKFIPVHPRLRLPQEDESNKSDYDIDEQVKVNPRPPNFSFRSIQVRTIRKPDGTTEEIRIERDGQGNETKTVITSEGDKNPQNILKNPFEWNPSRLPKRTLPPPTEENPTMDPEKESLFSKFFGKW